MVIYNVHNKNTHSTEGGGEGSVQVKPHTHEAGQSVLPLLLNFPEET